MTYSNPCISCHVSAQSVCSCVCILMDDCISVSISVSVNPFMSNSAISFHLVSALEEGREYTCMQPVAHGDKDRKGDGDGHGDGACYDLCTSPLNSILSPYSLCFLLSFLPPSYYPLTILLFSLLFHPSLPFPFLYLSSPLPYPFLPLFYSPLLSLPHKITSLLLHSFHPLLVPFPAIQGCCDGLSVEDK
jgi:hypothetical protein